MRSAADTMMAAKNANDNYRDDISTSMGTLRNSWEGEKSERFNEILDNWQVDFDELQTYLKNFVETTRESADNYDAAERA